MTSRRWLLLTTWLVSSASGLYACGLSLEASPSDPIEAGTSSGVGPRPSSSSSSSSTGGSSSSSSGDAATSSSSSSSGDAGGDGGSCETYELLATEVPCAVVDGPNSAMIKGHNVHCTRVSAVNATSAATLTMDETNEQLGLWIDLPISMSRAFEIEAVLDVKAVAGVGAGFGIGLVRANADAAVNIPTVGGTGPRLGMTQLENFSGVAALVQNYTNVVLSGVQVPDITFTTRPGNESPALVQRYHLRITHSGAPGVSPRALLTAEPTALQQAYEVELPTAGSAVESDSTFVGLTAATGGSTSSEQTLVSFSVRTCD